MATVLDQVRNEEMVVGIRRGRYSHCEIYEFEWTSHGEFDTQAEM